MEKSSLKKVSVILPNYNYARYFCERMDEILHQSYPVSEIIVLDDASTDNSVEVIKQKIVEIRQEHPDIKIKTEFNRKNSGNVFSQWQKGISLATGDYIWICELDDRAKSNFLENIMAGFESKRTILSYSNSKIIDDNDRIALKDSLRKAKDVFRKKHKFGKYIISGMMELNKNLAVYNSIPNVSAVVFRKISGIDNILEQAKQYKLCGDWYFYIELAKRGNIAYTNKILNYHRIHNNSVTNSIEYDERLKEIISIHNHVQTTTKLEKSTVVRIRKMEEHLAKNWGISE